MQTFFSHSLCIKLNEKSGQIMELTLKTILLLIFTFCVIGVYSVDDDPQYVNIGTYGEFNESKLY